MILSQSCIAWYNNVFKTTKLFKDMEATVEGSPWHRERNVGVHTDMVVGQYIASLTSPMSEWTPADVLGFFCCVFHDVGKPSAEIQKHSEARGDYRAYHGHEQVSARMWEDYVCSNADFVKEFEFSDTEIWGISWIIEHHVPWATKDAKKRMNYAKTVFEIFDCSATKCLAFFNVLMADTYGRISDDADDKIEKSLFWIDEFFELLVEVNQNYQTELLRNDSYSDTPILYVPIAASGTGKSTYFNTLTEVKSFSLDDLRLKWYEGNYSECFKQACEDKDFKVKANAVFLGMLVCGDDVFVDNCNLSTKSRRFYVDEARKKGYRVVAVTFPISKVELHKRLTNRTDKAIMDNAGISMSMYDRIQQPSMGEFDFVNICLT